MQNGKIIKYTYRQVDAAWYDCLVGGDEDGIVDYGTRGKIESQGTEPCARVFQNQNR